MSNKVLNQGEKNNQLINMENYDIKNMLFSEPVVSSIPGTEPPINYRRINIGTVNSDGSVGDLIIPTGKLFSFGVGENKDLKTKNVNGYSMSLCLWSREGPTKAEKKWTDLFDMIIDNCKKHLLENKDRVDQYDLDERDLKKFNPLYWKKEKGKVVEGTGPTLYAKLIIGGKNKKILSMFHDEEGNNLEPMSLLGKYCHTIAAIKVESIFIGAKIAMQVKLYEAEVKLIEQKMKPLIQRPKTETKLITSNFKNSNNPMIDDDDDDKDETGSLKGDDDQKEDIRVKTETKVRKPSKIVKSKV